MDKIRPPICSKANRTSMIPLRYWAPITFRCETIRHQSSAITSQSFAMRYRRLIASSHSTPTQALVKIVTGQLLLSTSSKQIELVRRHQRPGLVPLRESLTPDRMQVRCPPMLTVLRNRRLLTKSWLVKMVPLNQFKMSSSSMYAWIITIWAVAASLLAAMDIQTITFRIIAAQDSAHLTISSSILRQLTVKVLAKVEAKSVDQCLPRIPSSRIGRTNLTGTNLPRRIPTLSLLRVVVVKSRKSDLSRQIGRILLSNHLSRVVIIIASSTMLHRSRARLQLWREVSTASRE